MHIQRDLVMPNHVVSALDVILWRTARLGLLQDTIYLAFAVYLNRGVLPIKKNIDCLAHLGV